MGNYAQPFMIACNVHNYNIHSQYTGSTDKLGFWRYWRVCLQKEDHPYSECHCSLVSLRNHTTIVNYIIGYLHPYKTDRKYTPIITKYFNLSHKLKKPIKLCTWSPPPLKNSDRPGSNNPKPPPKVGKPRKSHFVLPLSINTN